MRGKTKPRKSFAVILFLFAGLIFAAVTNPFSANAEEEQAEQNFTSLTEHQDRKIACALYGEEEKQVDAFTCECYINWLEGQMYAKHAELDQTPVAKIKFCDEKMNPLFTVSYLYHMDDYSVISIETDGELNFYECYDQLKGYQWGISYITDIFSGDADEITEIASAEYGESKVEVDRFTAQAFMHWLMDRQFAAYEDYRITDLTPETEITFYDSRHRKLFSFDRTRTLRYDIYGVTINGETSYYYYNPEEKEENEYPQESTLLTIPEGEGELAFAGIAEDTVEEESSHAKDSEKGLTFEEIITEVCGYEEIPFDEEITNFRCFGKRCGGILRGNSSDKALKYGDWIKDWLESKTYYEYYGELTSDEAFAFFKDILFDNPYEISFYHDDQNILMIRCYRNNYEHDGLQETHYYTFESSENDNEDPEVLFRNTGIKLFKDKMNFSQEEAEAAMDLLAECGIPGVVGLSYVEMADDTIIDDDGCYWLYIMGSDSEMYHIHTNLDHEILMVLGSDDRYIYDAHDREN